MKQVLKIYFYRPSETFCTLILLFFLLQMLSVTKLKSKNLVSYYKSDYNSHGNSILWKLISYKYPLNEKETS